MVVDHATVFFWVPAPTRCRNPKELQFCTF